MIILDIIEKTIRLWFKDNMAAVIDVLYDLGHDSVNTAHVGLTLHGALYVMVSSLVLNSDISGRLLSALIIGLNGGAVLNTAEGVIQLCNTIHGILLQNEVATPSRHIMIFLAAMLRDGVVQIPNITNLDQHAIAGGVMHQVLERIIDELDPRNALGDRRIFSSTVENAKTGAENIHITACLENKYQNAVVIAGTILNSHPHISNTSNLFDVTIRTLIYLFLAERQINELRLTAFRAEPVWLIMPHYQTTER